MSLPDCTSSPIRDESTKRRQVRHMHSASRWLTDWRFTVA